MSATRGPFHYWAFVSYSHHDRRVARLIVRKLGERSVPHPYRARVEGSPANFAPLYLDEAETSAGSALGEELRVALQNSSKLIVICSPFAVGSRYVSREIAYFQSVGRGDDILCVIASGVPNASDIGRDDLECFPAPLRLATDGEGRQAVIPEADRPLAASLADESDQDWQNVIEQLEGGILGISRSDVARLRQGRRFRRSLIAVLLLATVIAIAGLTMWAFIWPHYTYASAVVRKWGLLEPVHTISRTQSKQRPASWRFEKDGAYGKTVRVLLVNQAGNCPIPAYEDPRVPRIKSVTGDDIDIDCSAIMPCGYKITHTPDGGVLTEALIDQFGNPIETLSYSSSVPKLAILTEASVGCSRTESQIEFIEIQRYDAGAMAGLDRRFIFKGGEDKQPRVNRSFVFGRQVIYDGAGMIAEETYLGESGRPRNSKDGFATVRYSRNAAGDVTERRYFDDADKPSNPAKESNIVTILPNKRGYGETIEFFDRDMRPATNERGIFSLRYIRNAKGQVTARETSDEVGRLVNDADGIATSHAWYDPYGFPSRFTADDKDGAPTMTAGLISESGRDDNKGVGGCFEVSITYDRYGRDSSSRCFKKDKSPELTLGGWHRRQSEFTSTGNVASETFWGLKGEPAAVIDREMSAKYRSTIHRSRIEWDQYGREVRRRFYRVDGQYAINSQGVSGWDYQYDGQGRIELRVFIGPDGKPSADPGWGCVGVRSEHDKYGNYVRSTCLDAEMKISPGKEGAAIGVAAYDQLGRKIKVTTYDVSGKPVMDANGVYGVSMEHDDRGNVVVHTLLSEVGEPMENSQGWIGWKDLYDDAGRHLGYDAIKKKGSSIHRRDCPSLRFDLDKFGRTVAERCLDESGSPNSFPDKNYATTRFTLDSRGSQIETRYFDNRDRPVRDEGEDGIFGYSSSYDERGRETKVVLRDAKGFPMESDAGWASREFKYNSQDLPVEERFSDLEGRPLSFTRTQFDSFGRTRAREFFDPDGRPMRHPLSGRAKVVFDYDSLGSLVQEASFDENGNPVNIKSGGWQRRTFSRTLEGGADISKCFDTDNRVVEPCNDA